MDRKKLLRMIQRDLNELTEITDEMAEMEKISALEVEFALGKSRFISQELDYLREVIHQQSLSETDEMHEQATIFSFPHTGQEANQAHETNAEEDQEDRKIVEFTVAESDLTTEESLTPEEEPVEPTEEIAHGIQEAEAPASPGIPEEISLHEQSQEKEPMPDQDIEPQPEETEMEEMPRQQNEEHQAPESNEQQMPAPEDQYQELHQPDDQQHQATVKKTVAEIFVQEKSVNEALSAPPSIDHKMAALPLSRLESAIGLNDRFLFIRELFNNEASLFNQTIRELDRMQTLSEAVNFLNGNFKWKKNEASLKFAQLVKRRFAK